MHVSLSSRSAMPRHRRPDTLKDAAIHCVASHESLWGREDLTRLPASLTEKLLDEVLQRMQSHGLDLLGHFQRSAFFGVRINHVSYKSWHCNLRYRKYNSSKDRWKYMSDLKRCFARCLQSSEQLVGLELNFDRRLFGDTHLYHDAFYLLSGCDLHNLQVLTLKGDFCENTMRLLGFSCPQLRELYLESFVSVHDDTIKILIEKGQDGQCGLKNLKVIDVRNTMIGEKGLWHILECIPTITHLYHPNVIPIALQLFRQGLLKPPLYLECLEIIGLQQLIYKTEYTKNVPLDLSAFFNVTSVVIVLEDSSEAEQLKYFYPLENLCTLKIRTNSEQPFLCGTMPASSVFTPYIRRQPTRCFVFDPWVSTLIQITGGNIRELWLEDVRYISFSTVGKACPNLHCFRVSYQLEWHIPVQSFIKKSTRCHKNNTNSRMPHSHDERWCCVIHWAVCKSGKVVNQR